MAGEHDFEQWPPRAANTAACYSSTMDWPANSTPSRTAAVPLHEAYARSAQRAAAIDVPLPRADSGALDESLLLAAQDPFYFPQDAHPRQPQPGAQLSGSSGSFLRAPPHDGGADDPLLSVKLLAPTAPQDVHISQCMPPPHYAYTNRQAAPKFDSHHSQRLVGSAGTGSTRHSTLSLNVREASADGGTPRDMTHAFRSGGSGHGSRSDRFIALDALACDDELRHAAYSSGVDMHANGRQRSAAHFIPHSDDLMQTGLHGEARAATLTQMLAHINGDLQAVSESAPARSSLYRGDWYGCAPGETDMMPSHQQASHQHSAWPQRDYSDSYYGSYPGPSSNHPACHPLALQGASPRPARDLNPLNAFGGDATAADGAHLLSQDDRTVRGGNAVRGGTALRVLHTPSSQVAPRVGDPLKPAVIRAGTMRGGEVQRKRKNLDEMVRAADKTAQTFGTDDSNQLGSSKRTRTTAPGTYSTSQADTSAHYNSTRLTGTLENVRLLESPSVHGGSRRGLGEVKEERSVDDWMVSIAKSEATGDAAAEAALLSDFRAWEARSKAAPNGKWRGANSRKWGKVGIEMRLTGNVPNTEGPVTALGHIVCKFVDIVDDKPQAAAAVEATASVSDTGGSTSVSTPRAIAEGRSKDSEESPGASAQRSANETPRQSPARAVRAAPAADEIQSVWRLMRTQDKATAGFKTVLKEKVWLGTYHTAINAAVHHDLYKVVLAVEGCIFTCAAVPTATQPLGKKKTHKLKLNFPLDDLPGLMCKAVRFSQLWNRHKQDAERYIFRNCTPEEVQAMVQDLLDNRCDVLRPHIATTETEGTVATVERRSNRRRTVAHVHASAALSGDDE